MRTEKVASRKSTYETADVSIIHFNSKLNKQNIRQ